MSLTLSFLIIQTIMDLHVLSLPSAGTLSLFQLSCLGISPSLAIRSGIRLLLIC